MAVSTPTGPTVSRLLAKSDSTRTVISGARVSGAQVLRPCLDEFQADPDLAARVRAESGRRGGSRDDAGSYPPERR
jgi:hypothetical protein